MKRIFKNGIIVIIGVLVIVGGYFALAFFGNPISKVLANKAAKAYVDEKYGDMDLFVENTFYSFKDGYYHNRARKKGSRDIEFTIATDFKGKVIYDEYISEVLSGLNTYRRLEHEYRKLADSVFEREDFPYEKDIFFGTLLMYEKEDSKGLNMSKLEIDKDYDILDLGKDYGELVIYLYDEDVSVERAGEMILKIKDLMDKERVPFKYMDFNLYPPKEEGEKNDHENHIGLENFLYEDIYEEGLEERIEKADKELKELYKILDKNKKNR